MEVQIAVAKVSKYATSTSGDTVEVVERPHGGVSAVLADGQSSGRGAKTISNLVVRKVITLLAEGVRDGASARAASDNLFTERKGKVSAALNILSVDYQTRTLVITRNNPVPAILAYRDEIKWLSEESIPIGLYRDTRPVIIEVPLQAGLVAIAFSDGIIQSGDKTGQPIDVVSCLQGLLENESPSPQLVADTLLEQAQRLDNYRPGDDMSVVVVGIMQHSGDEVRRMTVRLPLEPNF